MGAAVLSTDPVGVAITVFVVLAETRLQAPVAERGREGERDCIDIPVAEDWREIDEVDVTGAKAGSKTAATARCGERDSMVG